MLVEMIPGGQAGGSNTDYDFGVARLMNDLIFADRFGGAPQDE